MERELPPYRAAVTKPARASIWPTVAITAVLLAVAGCGIYLLGQTHARWEKNRADKAARIAEFERQWTAQEAATKAAQTEEDRRQIEEMKAEIERERLRPLNPPESLRCINGQLFRRIPGGWENLPDSSC